MGAENLLQQISSCCCDGRLGTAVAVDIKAQLAAPFKPAGIARPSSTSFSAATPAAAAAAAAATDAAAAATTSRPPPSLALGALGAAGGFTGFASSLQPQPQSLGLLGAVGDSPATQAIAVDTLNENVTRARSLLTLLVLCGEPERLVGVNDVIAAIAPSAAVNILQFIQAELAPTGASPSGQGSASTSSSSNFAAHGKSNPVLLSAQCLLLLTRHFQMQESFVRDLCRLLELLMEEVRRHMHSAVVSSTSFRQHPSTAGVCAVMWLVTVSLVNALAVWRPLRDCSGKASENALLRSGIITEVEKCVGKIQSRFEHEVAAGSLSFPISEHRSKQQLNVGWLPGDGRPVRWMSIMDGYVSIIVLAIGIFLCGKGDERGLDKAVEAFVGNRVQSPNASHRGKVMKHLVQLAPAQTTLVIPPELVYIIPYEMMAYLFDEMLPAIKHVADLDVRSCVRYLESLQAGMDGFHGEKFGSATTTTMKAAATATAAAAVAGRAGGEIRGGLHQHGTEMVVQDREEPFMSETAHILHALTVCLENLPASVLNPDMDSDCAVTFFIFKNCVTHMRSVFQTQRPNVLWEPYTLKVVTDFLGVLAMIGRNPQCTERVAALFSEMQVDCMELQWSSLIGQVQECAGISGGVGSLLSLDTTAPIVALKKPSASTTSRHRHFTPGYLQAKQQAYTSSVFMLLRQMATHPLLREQVRQYTTLGTALDFLYAPRLSQSVLGKVLSLIGSLITNNEEASHVWTFLEENHLLRTHVEAGGATGTAHGRHGGRGEENTLSADDENAVTVEARSLMGHCQYESHHATYSITVGFLDLMLAMLKYHVVEVAHVPTYTMVIRFIAEEIFRGVLRRFFSSINERYTVTALAAAVLNRALSLRLSLNTNKCMIPLTVVMACSKAPADVVGEALQVISEASTTPNEMPNYQRAAVRQCLALLKTAIVVKREQGLDSLFTFDAKTASNTELAVQLLPLCASIDSLLANKALQLLLLIPQPTVSQAARQWFSRPDAQEAVITPFVAALRAEAVSNPIIHAPPALAVLDHDEVQLMLPHAEVETKSLIMDLLIQHARAPQTSITSWLCGYPLYGSSGELLAGYCLEPIIEGVHSREMEEIYPHIAVKYVKLLYLLRANSSLSTPSLQRLLKRRGNDEMFYVLQTLRPDQCPPLMMSKYAFVMKLLALDVFSIGTKAPEELNNVSPLTRHSSLVELLFLLLRVSGNPDEVQTGVTGEDYDACVAVDFAYWPLLSLKSLPVFPTTCMAPGGAESYVFRTNDDIPQYSIPLIYEALQRESMTSTNGPLTAVEIRERLSAFVKANECLSAYAGGVQFIDGWCSLANICVTLIDLISHKRIVHLAQHLLEAVQLASSLTVASQEQIVYRLSQTLSTFMAQLGRKMILNKCAGRNKVIIGGGGGGGGDGSSGGGGGDGKFVTTYEHVQDSTIHLLQGENEMSTSRGFSQRTRPGTTNILQASMGSSHGTKMALVEVGGQGTRGGKRDARGALVERHNAVVDVASRSLIGVETLQLLKSLLVTTVQWGAHVPLARQHLYNAIMAFLGIPGISIDDITLQRYYNAFFGVLVQDISVTSPDGNRLAALTVLGQLLHLSPQLCEMFCVPLSGDGARTHLMTCITSAFQAIDELISVFFSHGGADAASILSFVRVVYNVLMIVSQQHAVQLLQVNALSQCMAMKLWKTSTRVVLGHVNITRDPGAYISEDIEVYKEVMKSVLLETTCWFNAVLSAVDNSEVALMPIAEFVRANQLLFQNVLGSPLADLRQRLVCTLNLELLGEINAMLYRLACSPLVDECRTLVHLFALPDLVVVLTTSDFLESPIFASGSSELMAVNQQGSHPSAHQRLLTSTAVQNILLFLVRAENLGQLFADGVEENPLLQKPGRESNVEARLCDDVRTRVLILTTMEQVIAIMENFYNSQVLQIALFSSYLIALHCLVLFLHAFLLSDQALPVQTKSTCSQWGSIVHILEEAQRVVNLWKAFHSDYRRGLKLSRTGNRWSVAAPSVSNQSIQSAITLPPQDRGQRITVSTMNPVDTSVVNSMTLMPNDAPTRRSQRHGVSYDVDQSYTNQLSNVSCAGGYDGARDSWMGNPTSMTLDLTQASPPTLAAGSGGVSIGALVEMPQTDGVWEVDENESLHVTWDEVLIIESLMRQVKVAISNALRTASRT